MPVHTLVITSDVFVSGEKSTEALRYERNVVALHSKPQGLGHRHTQSGLAVPSTSLIGTASSCDMTLIRGKGARRFCNTYQFPRIHSELMGPREFEAGRFCGSLVGL